MNAPLIILAIIFAVQLIIPKARLKEIGLFGIIGFLSAVGVIFGMAAYQSWRQYLTWQSNDLSKLFLPPYQGWDYFVFYVRTRFFNSYFLSLGLGLLGLTAAKYFNKKYQERFFEPIEPYLLATALFAVGHPLWLFYSIILLTVNFLLSTFYFLLSRKKDYRLSFYYLWLPTAILTIIISEWLSRLPWWQTFKF